jgi:uncharacterized membrane protein
MLSSSLVIALRLIHIVVGVCWVGAVVFIAAFLLPTMKAVGPAAGPVMGHLTQVKKLPMYLMAGVILTVLSGIALFWNDSVGFSSEWMHSGPGRTFSLGGVLGIVVGIMGMTINSPTAKKMGKLGEAIRASGGVPSAEQAAELARLQNRLAGAMRVAAVLLLIAAGAMAVARYVPS